MMTHTQPASGAPALLRAAWATHRLLTVLSMVSLGWLAVAVAGMLIDPRIVLGMPNWAKSAKFAISLLLYSASLMWAISLAPNARTRRLAGRAGNVVAIALLLEIAVILLQSLRGVPSHFNIASVFDGAMWSVMAVSIAVFWGAFGVAIVLLWRQFAADPVTKWAVRLGLLITFVGFGQGYLMTSPTAVQLAGLQAGDVVTLVGAHTVGAPDGGAGLPLLGWSTAHGDLRIGHFIGAHALQVIPLIGLLLARLAGSLELAHRVRLVWLAAAGWLGLLVITTWQALRAESIVAPSATTLTAAFAFFGLVSAIAVMTVARGTRCTTVPNAAIASQ